MRILSVWTFLRFLFVFVCSSTLALLLQVSPSCAASACLHLHILFLFRLPASFSVTIRFSCPLMLVYGFFSCLDICSFLTTLSFARFSTCFFPRGSLCLLSLSVVCRWFPLTPSQFLIPFGSHSASLSFAPMSFRLAVSFFFCYFSLGCHLHIVSGTAFPRFYRLSLLGLFSPSLAVLG